MVSIRGIPHGSSHNISEIYLPDFVQKMSTSRNAYVMFGGYRSVMLAIAVRYPPNIT